ncbi:histidine phosphatase family protein [Bacillus toyonensis]|uniref:histidine phosphatase family protein n=1 Tax=Bacillus toyonensis TaxID=155322 RepID=UPI000BF11055|nr:histidine phosphatase family protein [Bacillus toyonensis]PEK99430.1 histidine phosphatase family protein [Bacillus toyonensis]PEO24343.1 histidine phosphatase family protein [Bacillus toyonensis]PFX40818.1 histidine phosphatase family protein [Bacillus toyonensis]PFX98954.1 histidine phosphatase family protein [Bacillus toyonensis]PGC10272.1 histidine phosphatase family protein [Bacillus toyonensis]
MKTFIYMVRHGDSPKFGKEETRELTEKGKLDVQRITDALQGEEIDVVISSPYKRSILTVQQLAKQIGQEVIVFEDLKERIFIAEEERMSDKELFPLIEKSFIDPNFALMGGESNVDCQKRAIKVLKELLNTYRGQKVVLGTHGAVMTLMMGYYESKYNFNFLLQTSKPDIYRMEFNGQELVEVKRLWEIS